MSGFTPQKSREVTLQILFALDHGAEASSVCALMQRELSLSKEEVKQALEKAESVLMTKEELDQKIEGLSEKYPLNRIAFLDRNILRLGVFELLSGLLPHKVVISEAIRLARKFSSPESGKFVNALLDAFMKKQFPSSDV